MCEQWTHCINDITEEEQTLPDKTEMGVNMDLKVTKYKNDMGKDDILDRQMKPVVLIIKRDVQITSQNSDLDNLSILYWNYKRDLLKFERIF